MVQALNFTKDAESGMYVAEAVVTAACNLHIKFPEAAVVAVQKSTADDAQYALHRKYSVCLYPCVMDEDIAFDVYPKRLRILTAVLPDAASLRSNANLGDMEQAIEQMQSRMAEQERINDEQQAQINKNAADNDAQQQEIDQNRADNDAQQQQLDNVVSAADIDNDWQ